jgi:hypothetical protein
VIARFAALGLAVALLASPPASAQRTVTKLDIRTQDMMRTDAQLRDQLWGVFRREDRRSDSEPTQPLRDVWLTSTPYSTEVPGLCRRDLLTLRLAPLKPERRSDARTPTRAYGFTSAASFRFLSAPGDWHDVIADRGRLPWAPECAGQQKEASFFFAPDTEVATDGVRAMMLARAAVAAGKIEISDCQPVAVERRSCREILAAWPEQPDSVAACAAPRGQECYELLAGDEQLTVMLHGRYDNPDIRTRGKLVSVRLDFLITLSHPRPD